MGLIGSDSEMLPWVKDKKFQNPELEKFKFLNLQHAYKMNNFMFK